jgi:hypothetical protein
LKFLPIFRNFLPFSLFFPAPLARLMQKSRRVPVSPAGGYIKAPIFQDFLPFLKNFLSLDSEHSVNPSAGQNG